MGMKGIINVTCYGYNIIGQWTDNNDNYFEVSNDSFLVYSFEQEDCYNLQERNWVCDGYYIALGKDDKIAGEFILYDATDDFISLGQTPDETTLLTSTSFTSSDWVECNEVTSILSNNIKSKKIVYILNVLGEKVNKPNDFSPHFYYYDDGSVEKKVIIE
jgi:hypothetical protein